MPEMPEDSSASSVASNSQSDRMTNHSADDDMKLNDDIANDSTLQITPDMSRRGSESVISFRNSIDSDGSFLNSTFLQGFAESVNKSDSKISSFSPLGPNSIYELTISSDISRAKKGKQLRNNVLLNDGTLVIDNLKRPTTKDIPQVHLSKLKHKTSKQDIENNIFYNIEDDYKRFERTNDKLTTLSLQKLDQVNSDSLTKVVSTKQELIPSIFKDPNFRLDNPRTFEKVFGRAKLFPSNDDEHIINEDEPLTENMRLQELFSEYLAVIENSLIEEISDRSDSFFDAIYDIKDLQKDSEACTVSVQAILDSLKLIETDNAQKGLEILHLIEKRRSVAALESAVLQIKYAQSILNLAGLSLRNENLSKCLSEIDIAESLILGRKPTSIPGLYPKLPFPPVDLSSLNSLSQIPESIKSLKYSCGQRYVNLFVETLVDDLKDYYNSVDNIDTIKRLDGFIVRDVKHSNLNNSYQLISDEKRSQLKSYVKDLFNSENLISALYAYQERIVVEVKNIIKLYLPKVQNQDISTIDLSNSSSRSSSAAPELHPSISVNELKPQVSLTNAIKGMTPKEFEDMMIDIYTTLSECLRRLTSHQKLILDLCLTASTEGTKQDQTLDVMTLDISPAIEKSIILTQVRITKVVNVRSEQLGDLPISQYYKFYALTSAYIQECELINPGSSTDNSRTSLNTWLKNQISYYIHRFHSNSLLSITKECEKEIWKEVNNNEDLEKYQQILIEIGDYAAFYSSDKMKESILHNQLFIPGLLQDATYPTESKVLHNGRLTVGSESFLVPKLAFYSLRTTKDYLIISQVFPNKSSSIKMNILGYYRLTCLRISQAILNAGATRTAGLKHITTKHIALCIQLVEFYIAFLQTMQPLFGDSEKELQEGNTDELTFSKVVGIFKDYENELFSKIISIMYDRTLIHCSNVLKVNFSIPLNSSEQCHQYMEVLVKETTTVTKVLTKYLPQAKCALVMSQIFDSYKKLLIECFCVNLPRFKDFNEKYTLLKDIDYFRVNLSELPGYGASGQIIWENVNSLPTLEDEKMEEIMRTNIQNETSINNGVNTDAQAAKDSTANIHTNEADTSDGDSKVSEEKCLNQGSQIDNIVLESSTSESVSNISPASSELGVDVSFSPQKSGTPDVIAADPDVVSSENLEDPEVNVCETNIAHGVKQEDAEDSLDETIPSSKEESEIPQLETSESFIQSNRSSSKGDHETKLDGGTGESSIVQEAVSSKLPEDGSKEHASKVSKEENDIDSVASSTNVSENASPEKGILPSAPEVNALENEKSGNNKALEPKQREELEADKSLLHEVSLNDSVDIDKPLAVNMGELLPVSSIISATADESIQNTEFGNVERDGNESLHSKIEVKESNPEHNHKMENEKTDLEQSSTPKDVSLNNTEKDSKGDVDGSNIEESTSSLKSKTSKNSKPNKKKSKKSKSKKKK